MNKGYIFTFGFSDNGICLFNIVADIYRNSAHTCLIFYGHERILKTCFSASYNKGYCGLFAEIKGILILAVKQLYVLILSGYEILTKMPQMHRTYPFGVDVINLCLFGKMRPYIVRDFFLKS